jgi:formylglycine-generating enzyme required for sulfatase activity
MGRAHRFAYFAALAACGCQLVGGFEDFDAGAMVETPAACSVLPEAKDDAQGVAVMARVDLPGATCLWMDRTEVTVAQYQQWLEATAEGQVAWEATWCPWKTARSQPATDLADECVSQIMRFDQQPFASRKPMRCVDFCDAEAYCRWAGKHLCYDRSALGNQGPSGYPREWLVACSNSRQTVYPWGDDEADNACNTGQSADACITTASPTCGPHAAGQGNACVNQHGIQDLLGNVAEWTFSCTFVQAERPLEPAKCLTRGGGYDDELRACDQEANLASDARLPSLGFRCCDDLSASEELAVSPTK